MSVLVILAVAFCGGVACGLAWPVPLGPAALFLAALTVPIAASVFTNRRLGLVLTVACFVCGWVRPAAETSTGIAEPRHPACPRRLEGRLVTAPVELDGRTRLRVELEWQTGCLKGHEPGKLEATEGELFLTVIDGEPLRLGRGDRIWFRARPAPFVSHRNRGTTPRFDGSRGQSAVIVGGEGVARVEGGASRIFGAVDSLRTALSRFWSEALGEPQAALARALTLGESQALGYRARESFRRTGTSHLVSVSGLHLGLVVVFVFVLLEALLVRTPWLAARLDVGRISAAFGIGVAVFFTLLAGSRVPVIRACVMAVSALTARLIGRDAATVEALALAGVSLLVADPESLGHPGFQLSFTAVVAFVLIGRRGGRSEADVPLFAEKRDGRLARLGRRAIRSAGELARSTLAAAAATAPLVVYHFGYFTLLTVPANLLAVPLTGAVVLPGLLIVGAISRVSQTLGELAARTLSPALDLLTGLLDALSRLPLVIEQPGRLTGLAIAVGCFGTLLLLAGRKRGGGVALCGAGALVAVAVLVDPDPIPAGRLTIDFMDVGQGDATLVTFPDGRHWLVDAGGTRSERFDVGERIVVPALRGLGVEEIDRLVVTHPDFDHVGGMPAVLAGFDVGEIWENGQGEAEGADPAYHRLLEAARSRRVPVRRTPEICGLHRVGEVTVRLIHPCLSSGSYDPGLSFNDNSIVLVVRYRGLRVVLPGDIEEETEIALVDGGSIGPVDVLKLPHHGSSTSSSAALLDATEPWLGVASLGVSRVRSILRSDVIHRLSCRGIALRRTDRQGAIRLVSDGRLTAIEPFSSNR